MKVNDVNLCMGVQGSRIALTYINARLAGHVEGRHSGTSTLSLYFSLNGHIIGCNIRVVFLSNVFLPFCAYGYLMISQQRNPTFVWPMGGLQHYHFLHLFLRALLSSSSKNTEKNHGILAFQGKTTCSPAGLRVDINRFNVRSCSPFIDGLIYHSMFYHSWFLYTPLPPYVICWCVRSVWHKQASQCQCKTVID